MMQSCASAAKLRAAGPILSVPTGMRQRPATGSKISIGLVAFGILLPAELAGVVWLRGLSLTEYLASFVTAPGLVSLLMFLLFAAMPTLVTRAGRG